MPLISFSNLALSPDEKFRFVEARVKPSQIVARFRDRVCAVLVTCVNEPAFSYFARSVELQDDVSALHFFLTCVLRYITERRYRMVKLPTYRLYLSDSSYWTVRTYLIYAEGKEVLADCPDAMIVEMWNTCRRCMSRLVVYIFE